MPGLIFQPERERKAYRLKCAFRTDSGCRGRSLEKLTLEAGKRFIADMAKQGWEFQDSYNLTLRGPKPWEEMGDLPRKSVQAKDTDVGRYVHQYAVKQSAAGVYEYSLDAGEKWELYGVFVRKEIPLGTRETA